jgi:hypothetical protein
MRRELLKIKILRVKFLRPKLWLAIHRNVNISKFGGASIDGEVLKDTVSIYVRRKRDVVLKTEILQIGDSVCRSFLLAKVWVNCTECDTPFANDRHAVLIE